MQIIGQLAIGNMDYSRNWLCWRSTVTASMMETHSEPPCRDRVWSSS